MVSQVAKKKKQDIMLIYYKRLSRCALYEGSRIRYYAKTTDNDQSKTEITMSMLLKEIDIYAQIVHTHSKEPDDIYPILKKGVAKLKSKLINNEFGFDPLVYKNNEIGVYSIYNYIVMAALFRVIVKGLSPYLKINCYSKYNGDITYNNTRDYYKYNYEDFFSKVNSWGNVNGILIVECKRTLHKCQSRLIKKLSPIVDSQLLSLIESFINTNYVADFCNVYSKRNCYYTYGNISRIYNDQYPEYFSHHYGVTYEADFIPKAYQALRYELFNFLLDNIDSEIKKRDFARIYEYILIPINKFFLTPSTPSIQKIIANTFIEINEIMHKCQLPLPMVEYVGQGSKFECFKEGFRVRVDERGYCKISNFNAPPISRDGFYIK